MAQCENRTLDTDILSTKNNRKETIMSNLLYVTNNYPSDMDIAEHVTTKFGNTVVAMRIDTKPVNNSYITNILIMN